MAMEKREGVPLEEARKKIFMRDSRGLIVKGRSSGGISRHKEVFAQEHAEMTDLGEIVKAVKPTVLIGAAAQPNVFTEEIVKDMCSFTEHPVIFALSNPTSKAECTAEEVFSGHRIDLRLGYKSYYAVERRQKHFLYLRIPSTVTDLRIYL